MSKAFTSDDAATWEPPPAVPTRERPVTPDGMDRLQTALRALLEVQRPHLLAQASRGEGGAAAALHEVERRAYVLSRVIALSRVVPPPPGVAHPVYFGAWVTVRDEEDVCTTYRIVGPDEIDLSRRWVSHVSPLGAALLGRHLGDRVTVRRPKGELEMEIVAIAAQEETRE